MLRSRAYGWYVVVILALVNFFHYAGRNVVFPVYDDLRANFGLSNSQLGLVGSVFFIAHALAGLPFGIAGDRVDRRRLLGFAVAMWSIGVVAAAAVDGFYGLLLSRAAVGFATAACVPLANALLCEVFAEERKAFTISMFNLGLFLGGAAGFGFGANLGYPLSFLIIGLPGVVLAVAVARLDVPPRRIAKDSAQPVWAKFRSEVGQLFATRSLRFVMMGASMMAFAAGGYLSWFFEFLSTAKGLGAEKAMGVFGIALVGGLAGVITGGVLGDRLRRRWPAGRLVAIVVGMVCTVPFALIALRAEVGAVFYIASWLTMFFISWYHGPMAATVDDLAPDASATTAQAVVISFMHFFGTAPSSWIVGQLADDIGLANALLVPTGAILVAAVCIALGVRSYAADYARAHPASLPGAAVAQTV